MKLIFSVTIIIQRYALQVCSFVIVSLQNDKKNMCLTFKRSIMSFSVKVSGIIDIVCLQYKKEFFLQISCKICIVCVKYKKLPFNKNMWQKLCRSFLIQKRLSFNKKYLAKYTLFVVSTKIMWQIYPFLVKYTRYI